MGAITDNLTRPRLTADFARSREINGLCEFQREIKSYGFNSIAVLTEISPNVPNISYDPVSIRCRGVLLEPSITYSIPNNWELWKNPRANGATGIMTQGDTEHGIQLTDIATDGSKESFNHYSISIPDTYKKDEIVGYGVIVKPVLYNIVMVVFSSTTVDGTSIYPGAIVNLNTGEYKVLGDNKLTWDIENIDSLCWIKASYLAETDGKAGNNFITVYPMPQIDISSAAAAVKNSTQTPFSYKGNGRVAISVACPQYQRGYPIKSIMKTTNGAISKKADSLCVNGVVLFKLMKTDILTVHLEGDIHPIKGYTGTILQLESRGVGNYHNLKATIDENLQFKLIYAEGTNPEKELFSCKVDKKLNLVISQDSTSKYTVVGINGTVVKNLSGLSLGKLFKIYLYDSENPDSLFNGYIRKLQIYPVTMSYSNIRLLSAIG